MGHVDDGPSIVDILRDWWPRRMHSEQEEAEAGVQQHGAGASINRARFDGMADGSGREGGPAGHLDGLFNNIRESSGIIPRYKETDHMANRWRRRLARITG